MESSQEKFILEQLNAYPVCEIKEKYTDKLKQVSTPAVRKILKQKFVSGSDMKAVLCLFNTLFLSSAQKREKGLYNLSSHINTWVTKMEKLPVKSVEGFIYLTDILSEDIKVVIKVPQKEDGFNSMVREYFIGIRVLNKLRYLIPTFVYTLGAFLCPQPTKTGKLCSTREKKTVFVLYEQIPGDTVEKLLETKQIKFNQWLLIFMQLLLALEIAQRETRFTHFDLHAGNVMIRKKENFSYTVPLDNTSYYINDPEMIPSIIDFGLSCVYVKDRYVGSYDFPNYGMLNFMVPGYDMYKFMVFCANYAKDPATRTNILNIFRFYGDDDPYNIYQDKMKGVKSALKVYCADASFSHVATYTPGMMIDWLWKKYQNILQPHITVTDRLQYLPIRYSSTIKEYDDIFNYSSQGRQRAINLADECINLKPSYVMTKYNSRVLERYNKGLRSHDLASRIKAINMYLNSTENLIEIDQAMLENVFRIPLPKQHELNSVVENILKIKIRHIDSEDKEKAISELDILVYQEKLNPYLQFYFTILELDLEDKFSDWIQRFRASDIFRFYVKNISQNERVIRWGQTLLASIS